MDHVTPGKGLTTVGKILNQMFRSPTGHALQDQLVICLELIRAEYLSGVALHPRPKDTPFDATTPPTVRLLSRTFSLVPLRITGTEPWDGPVDWDLAAFHCIASLLTRSLRNLHEMLFLSLALRRRIAVQPMECVDLTFRLPFAPLPPVSLGVVLKTFLLSPPGTALPTVAAAVDLRADLHAGLKLWDQVHQLARVLAQSNLIAPETLAEFDAANTLLHTRLDPVI